MRAYTFAGHIHPDPENMSDYKIVSGMVTAESPVVATTKLLLKYPDIDINTIILFDATTMVLAFGALQFAVPVNDDNLEEK